MLAYQEIKVAVITHRLHILKLIFFSQNLSNYIQNAKLSSDYNKMEIPFEVIIPENIWPSYDGKSARVRYKVKATIDKMKAIDSNKSITLLYLGKKTILYIMITLLILH
jgi:Arrestin (or S-antigen), N-terminal domain